jgi:KDO2-lipid IV(A) lauroyltransferase
MLRLLSFLPLPVLYALFGVVARLFRAVGWRRELVDQGIARCLPAREPRDRKEVAQQFYVWLGQLAAEFVAGARMPEDALADRLGFENEALVRDALRDGRRVLLLAAHHCNWEWLLLRCSTAFGEPLVAAYKPASRETADRVLRDMRGRFRATMIPAPDLVQHLIRQRGAVRLLAMLADQSPSARSEQQIWLPFLGEETSFFQGPGWIAAKLGYVPVFIAMRREARGRYVARFVPLVAPGEKPGAEQILKSYVAALEQQVRQYPAQYFWAYNRWKRAKRLYE